MRAGAKIVLVRIRLPFGSCIMRIETASTATASVTLTPAAAALPVAPGTPDGAGGTDPQSASKHTTGDSRALQDAVQSANDVVQQMATNLKFETDQSTGKVVVRVIDAETQEVLRQMPSEEMLALSKSIDGMRGMMIHLKA